MTTDRHAPRAVEQHTQEWVRDRFVEGIAKGNDPDGAVYGADGQPRRMSRYQFQALQRKLKIFRWLERLQFSSFIDIGSGFDYYPFLVNARYGVPAYYSDLNHQLNMPFDGVRTGKIDHAVTLNLASLPFADSAFDIVVASEVLEHLVRPVEAIAELLRITRVGLIMTSLEALSRSRWEQLRAHYRVDVRVPHVERNFFLMGELETLFGEGFHHENLLYAPALPASPFASEAEQEAAYAALRDRTALAAALCRAVAVTDHGPGAMGILLLKTQPGVRVAAAEPEADRRLANWLIAQSVSLEQSGYAASEKFWNGTAEFPERDDPIADALLALVRCPDCRALLEREGIGVRCARCATTFKVEYGVPVLYPMRDHTGDALAAESLERLCAGDPQRRRAVQQLMQRLRRNERPPTWLRQQLWRLDDALRASGG